MSINYLEPISMGREVTGDWRLASSREWLITNGLGSFAAGTVAGANTRRYHGLLVASLSPPVDRVLMVAALDVAIEYLGHRYELQSHEYADGTIHPKGFLHIESFALDMGVPTWRYAVADAILEKKVFMTHGKNTTYVALRLVRASDRMRVTLRPMCTYRDYHHQTRGTREYQVVGGESTVSIQAGPGAAPYYLSIDAALFDPSSDWYWNFRHAAEAERGLDDQEDLFSPGVFTAELQTGESRYLVATTESDPQSAGDSALAGVIRRARGLLQSVPDAAPSWIGQLALAADQFIVTRGRDDTGSTVIAGYPWFTDWGRDTMIALPGLTSTLGRHDLAAAILRTFARHVDRGMLPNRFPDHSGAAEYNTVDATLWFFEAIADCLHGQRNASLMGELYPVLLDIIRAHVAGTRYGIVVDTADGLLRAGEPGVQLTWMDAKVGDWVVTPRIGKPVEINALWLNALNITLTLAGKVKDRAGQSLCRDLLRQGTDGFSRFWNQSQSCLYDVIDTPDGGVDASLRPNQLFAVSLPYSALDRVQMRSVVDLCAHELLTSYGLRSLAPSDPHYVGHYGGDPRARDGAYHQGTVWNWLLGPFSLAHYRAYGDARLAQSFLEPLAQHLANGCIGSVSEIMDGDSPFMARGCFAQAWSVAEALRAWVTLDHATQNSRSERISA